MAKALFACSSEDVPRKHNDLILFPAVSEFKNLSILIIIKLFLFIIMKLVIKHLLIIISDGLFQYQKYNQV